MNAQCACGDEVVDLESADYVLMGRPYCNRRCYDLAVQALSASAVTAEEKEALAFHISAKQVELPL